MTTPNSMPTFISKSDEQLCQILKEASSTLNDESLIKITRQLEFWSEQSLSSSDFSGLAQRLVDAAEAPMKAPIAKIPTVRYGEQNMHFITVCTGIFFNYLNR